TDCSAGNYCAGGVCTPQNVPGVACGGANQCASGECIDGVCCATACNGQCEACDVPGSAGACTNVVGAPHGARQACASDGTLCGGVCDGSSPAQCAYPGASVQCRAQTCSSGVVTEAASCTGSGTCPAAVQDSCGGAACNGSACAGATCTS